MTAYSVSALGAAALVIAALLFAAALAGVKLRAASRRGCGVSVYDFGADLTLPRALPARSYQIALYLTMKSLPREPQAPKVSARAAAR